MVINEEMVGIMVTLGIPMIGVIVWLSRLGARVDQNDKDHVEIKASLLEMSGKLDKVLEKTVLLQFCPLNNIDCPVEIQKKNKI